MKYLILSLFILILSCTEDNDPILFNSTLNLPTEYQYELSIHCFCNTSYVGPHRLRIRNNEILEYKLLDSDEELIDSSLILNFTIDSLASQVKQFQSQNPVIEEIETHPVYNFPVKVYFDVSAMIADEEWGYEITHFEVIQD